MTGEELRAALTTLGMTQKRFGAAIKMTEEHINRLVNGRSPIPYWMELVVNTMVEKHNAFGGSNTHLSLVNSSPEDAAQ